MFDPKKDYAPDSCGYHARMMLALMGGEPVGPATKALVEKFGEKADEQCIAAESQIVFLFGQAFTKDTEEKTP
jgi:hypothetical protein